MGCWSPAKDALACEITESLRSTCCGLATHNSQRRQANILRIWKLKPATEINSESRWLTECRGFCIRPVHNKVISGFQALRQARAPVAGLETDRRVPADLRWTRDRV
ncbi:hypothetical protein PoB_007099500 [Plakobranchus ocellatus]|uniref:Uncharacterized protein n=1 Tax=Plakobranchus ocellatus TaxID=259542 RepID=A0AAV4DKE7_9GAST|nr:hypothetical protein PoB_007099500 [Plakobranchus ocellatus]